MKIIVGTGYNKGYRLLGDYTRQINAAYAQRHGYEFRSYCKNWDKRPASWHKILFAQHVIDDCDWFIWVDADACVVNPSIKVEQLIEGRERNFMILGRGKKNTWAFNMGIFILRSCPKTKKFLQAVYGQKKFVNHQWWEQAAALHICEFKDPKKRANNKFASNICVLDYGTIWSRPEDITDSVLIAHCAGGGKKIGAKKVMLKKVVEGFHD